MRQCIKRLCLALLIFVGGKGFSALGQEAITRQPNVILIMADDLGYGDTGFNGNELIKTPNLDRLAKQGMIFRHFYAGNSVCSPTRGTCLTGRFHDRFGVFSANVGHLPSQEFTLAEMLQKNGYMTGHFGKWHLGTLSRTVSSKGPRRKPELNYSPPWERHYDFSFVTESAIQLWNPGLGKRAKDNPFYENGVVVPGDDPSLLGGASRVVMDRVIPFIDGATEQAKPFLSVIWFHAPHADVVAGPEYLAMYEGHGEAAHFYGCVTEMDEQVGRLMNHLQEQKLAENTIIFFCSDNGPEGRQRAGRYAGTTGGYRGRKRALYDGGVRVPAFVVWPGVAEPGSETNRVCSTLDYLPTIAHALKLELPSDRDFDGESIVGVLRGNDSPREKPIPFRYANGTSAWIEDGFKLVMPNEELYFLEDDPTEASNLAESNPAQVEKMKRNLIRFFDDVEESFFGGDYRGAQFEPTNNWRSLKLEQHDQEQ